MAKFEKTINTLTEWISKCVGDPTLELETKFGTLSADRQLKSFVNAATFYRILNVYQGYKWPETTTDTVDTVVYLPNRVNARLTFKSMDDLARFIGSNYTSPDPQSCVIKTLQDTNEDLEYNVKYSLAKETGLEWSSVDAKPSGIQSIRHKKRTTLEYKFVKYDFTIVNTYKYDFRKQSFDYTGIFHEMELEFIGKKVKPDTLIKDLVASYFKYVQTVQQYVQDSKYLMSNTEHHEVKLQIIKQSHNGTMVLGPQPDTLQVNHLTKVMSKMYAVTPKMDGERRMMFINDKGYIYLIDRNQKITKHAKAKPNDTIYNTILDGEYLKKSPQEYHAFDVIIHNGKDLRENIEYGLMERLNILKVVLENLRTNAEDIMVFPKKHYTSEKMMYLDSIGNSNLPEGVDGLIFTPIHEPLPAKIRWPSMFKWKPAHLQTVDLQIINSKGHVTDVGNQLVPFEPAGSTVFDISLEGLVVECVFDTKTKTFIPMKPRYDKQKPNFKMVGFDVWNAIQNPITHTDFKGNHFSDLRAFHNRIKQEVLKEHCVTGPITMLDLCCGRGSDFHKYKHNVNVKQVIGIDKSSESIDSAKQRHPDGTFQVGDLMDPEVWTTLPKVDMIVCHFAVHYFCESYDKISELCYNVSQHLKENGVLIMTYLDSDTVLKYLYDIKANRRLATHNGSTFNIKFGGDYNNDFESVHRWGVPIEVQMVGDPTNYLTQKSREYLVYSDLLCDVMESHNMCFDYSKAFSELYDQAYDKLNDDEREYSFMNRLIVFKKVESKIGRIENFIKDNKLDNIFDIPRKALGPLRTRLITVDQLVNVLSTHFGVSISIPSELSVQDKLSKISSSLNIMTMILDATKDVLDLYMHSPVDSISNGLIVLLGKNDSVQLMSTVTSGIMFPSHILIEMASEEGPPGDTSWSPKDEVPSAPPPTRLSTPSPTPSPTPSTAPIPTPATSSTKVPKQDTSSQAMGPEKASSNQTQPEAEDSFMGRPIASGTRQERWSLEEVKTLTKSNNWKVPSNFRRKEEIIVYLKQHYVK
jgi:SAM-dependent methyltransferase